MIKQSEKQPTIVWVTSCCPR